jgi:hypothetical protein
MVREENNRRCNFCIGSGAKKQIDETMLLILYHRNIPQTQHSALVLDNRKESRRIATPRKRISTLNRVLMR